MLREYFLFVLNNYKENRQLYKTVNEIPELARVLDGKKSKLATELYSKANLDLGYICEGSVGKGNITNVPWLAVFDKDITQSAQEGYYIVYLFKKDMSGVYLSLNQGWTQYEKNYSSTKSAKNAIKSSSLKSQQLLRSLHDFSREKLTLNDRISRAKGYEIGNICSKYYEVTNFPTDQEIISDLRNLIGVYRELKGLIGTNILNIHSVEINGLDNEESYQQKSQIESGFKLPEGPIPTKDPTKKKGGFKYNRNPAVANKALRDANYTCEFNSDHKTFTKIDANHMFMEAHHLIPIGQQEQFKYSLDVPENIISLCPNCHRAIHHSALELKKVMLSKIFFDKEHKLHSRGLALNFKDLVGMYR